jgi:hypothetical protein
VKYLFKKWHKYIIKENAYAFGTFGVNVAAGKPSKPCPQGQEQNGFNYDGSPYCRPEPQMPQKKIKIKSIDKVQKHLHANPLEPINIDVPRGSTKAFGTTEGNPLPFDYGEWPNIVNPADDMGWDFIIVPSSSPSDSRLIPVGVLKYNNIKPEKIGNDKIILAPGAIYTRDDKEILEDFFKDLPLFSPIEWY